MKWQLAPCFFTPLPLKSRRRMLRAGGWFSVDRGEAPARFFAMGDRDHYRTDHHVGDGCWRLLNNRLYLREGKK